MAQQLNAETLQKYLEIRAFEEGRLLAWDALDGGQSMGFHIRLRAFKDVAETFGLFPDRVTSEFGRGYTFGINGG